MANANMQYNVVDCPTGVVPVTHVDPALDNLPPNFWAKDQRHSIILSKACERVYDPAKMAGLPVGIQVRFTCFCSRYGRTNCVLAGGQKVGG
jgi:hypothetical protein